LFSAGLGALIWECVLRRFNVEVFLSNTHQSDFEKQDIIIIVTPHTSMALRAAAAFRAACAAAMVR